MFISLELAWISSLTAPWLPVVTINPVGNVCEHETVPNPSGFPSGRPLRLERPLFGRECIVEQAVVDLLVCLPVDDGGNSATGMSPATTSRELSSNSIVNRAANFGCFGWQKVGEKGNLVSNG